MNLPRMLVQIATFGWTIWVKLLGPTRALKVVGLGMVASTALAIYLNSR